MIGPSAEKCRVLIVDADLRKPQIAGLLGVSNDKGLSGLLAGETVGGFSLLLSFNNTILGAPQSFTANPDGKMGALPLDLSGWCVCFQHMCLL